MPTFFSPGGRTFAGGDRMPCVIPWPPASGQRANAVTATSIEILVLIPPRTAVFFSLTSAPAPWFEPVGCLCPNALRLDSPHSPQTWGSFRPLLQSAILVPPPT